MDAPKPLGMITGSLVQQTSQPKSDPSEDERKLFALLQLGSHFWTPDFTRAQARALLADYLDDLGKFSINEVEVACRDWRRDVKNTKFPRAAQICALIEQDRKDRRERKASTDKGFKPSAMDKRPYPDGQSRAILWWHLPRKLWKPEWRESDVPDGELILDPETNKLRQAHRFS